MSDLSESFHIQPDYIQCLEDIKAEEAQREPILF
jgi:hypothetical protein